MDFMLFFQALLALFIVLGLMLLLFWFAKYCEVKGCKNPFFKKLNIRNRLSVVEVKRVDAKNTLVIARCDDDEYVLLLGNTSSLLLKTNKVSKNV